MLKKCYNLAIYECFPTHFFCSFEEIQKSVPFFLLVSTLDYYSFELTLLGRPPKKSPFPLSQVELYKEKTMFFMRHTHTFINQQSRHLFWTSQGWVFHEKELSPNLGPSLKSIDLPLISFSS